MPEHSERHTNIGTPRIPHAVPIFMPHGAEDQPRRTQDNRANPELTNWGCMKYLTEQSYNLWERFNSNRTILEKNPNILQIQIREANDNEEKENASTTRIHHDVV